MLHVYLLEINSNYVDKSEKDLACALDIVQCRRVARRSRFVSGIFLRCLHHG
jgi:hypothetical protein